MERLNLITQFGGAFYHVSLQNFNTYNIKLFLIAMSDLLK